MATVATMAITVSPLRGILHNIIVNTHLSCRDIAPCPQLPQHHTQTSLVSINWPTSGDCPIPFLSLPPVVV
eukprot:5809417-Lingulodinium_polyedra.AAC.1